MYTKALSMDRLKEIKDAYSDESAIFYSDGIAVLSDGRKVHYMDSVEFDRLFYSKIPESMQKRILTFECREAFWNRREAGINFIEGESN